MSHRHIILTSGEPAGIGPDICLLALREMHRRRTQSDTWQLSIAIDPAVWASRRERLGISADELPALTIVPAPCAEPVRPGQLNPANAPAVVAQLDHAIAGCMQGRYTAMVNAPLHKAVVASHIPGFSGHTEYLAQQSQTEQVVMMLIGQDPRHQPLRVALATTHLPLRAVADAITPQRLERILRVILRDLPVKCRHEGIRQARVLVTGLNPHAGEGGLLGHEEQTVIAPVIAALRAEGHDVRGPYPADTLFQPRYLDQADAVLAMYHDQGLPVLKACSFGHGINLSLGLPFLRVSVDHGTALDLAADHPEQADPGSLLAALDFALFNTAEAVQA